MSRFKLVKLIRVSPKTFSSMNKVSYSVFKKGENNIYNHFIKSDTEYSNKTLEQIINENIEHLYIKHDDFEKYSLDIKKHLTNNITSDSVAVSTKSEILYELASDTMYDLLSGEVTKRKIEQVDQTIDATITFILKEPNAIKSMLEVTNHDYYTYTHSVDVATYALTFGAYLGFNDVQLGILGKGAILHDLGKKRIPLSILNKKGALTYDEFLVMQNHPSYGVDILKKFGEEDPLLFNIIEQHHEKLNGQGYPKGLQGDEIHLFSQIVTICDIFNALTTKRPYKESIETFDALNMMYQNMKDELNIKLLTKFIKFMSQKSN